MSNGSSAATDRQVDQLATVVAVMQSDIAGIKATVAETRSTFQAGITGLGAQFASFRDEVLRAKAPNYSMALSGLGFLVLLGGVCAALILLQTQNVISPLASDLRSLAGAVQGQADRHARLEGQLDELARDVGDSSVKDAHSEQNRADLGARVERNGSAVAELRADTRAASEKTREIETQFDASAQLENTRWANQQRLNGMLWEQVFKGSRFPDQPYFFPNISGRHASAPTGTGR